MVPYANSAALHSVFTVYGIHHYFMASYSGIGHFLGAKVTKGGAVRYDKNLEPWIIRVMNQYIDKYCAPPSSPKPNPPEEPLEAF
jgi:hypothetical protein